MSAHPLNQTWQKQNQKLVPATFKKAIITAVQLQNNSADVYFVESPNTVVRSIPFSSAVDKTTIAAGNRCRVDLFDEKNSRDMVISYTY